MSSIRWWCLPVSVAMVALALAAPVAADDPGAETVRAALLAERIEAGDLEYRDSATGQIVVATRARVAELRRSLEPQFDRPSGARIDVADDGTVIADIDGAMRDVFIVRTNLDGTRERGCFRDLDAAIAFIIGLDIDASKHSGGSVPAKVVE